MDEPITYDERYTRYQTDRSILRKLIRRGYLRSACKQLQGPTLDFGCGIGELLERLPPGSAGLEYNKQTVEYCRARGLKVAWYDGFEDGWMLSVIPKGSQFQSMVLSHVLEHFESPDMILRALLEAVIPFGIQRILIIVPGPAGFRSDDTHLTYVDEGYLSRALSKQNQWRIEKQRRFPININWIGDYFPHHELQTVLVRSN